MTECTWLAAINLISDRKKKVDQHWGWTKDLRMMTKHKNQLMLEATIMSRSLFIFITPIVLSLDLISWSYPFSGSRPFHGLLLITLISFTLFITCRSLSFTSVSPLFHLCFTLVSLSSVMSYHILCTAMYSRVQLCAASPCSIYIQ